MQMPSIAAITGLLHSSMARSSVRRFGSAYDLGVPNSRMSAPPENPFPEPIKMIAPTAGSSSARANADHSKPRMSRPKLLTGGLSNLSTATPWVVSTPSLLIALQNLVRNVTPKVRGSPRKASTCWYWNGASNATW